MKNYLILAMILIAGLTAYPQATRSARESKSEKGSAKKETQHRSVTRSENKSSRTATVESSKKTTTRPEATKSKVVTRNNERTPAARSTSEGTRQTREQSHVRTGSDRPKETGNAERRQQTTVTRPENKSGSAATVQEPRNTNDRDFKVNSSSASRVYREGKGTLTRDDGKVVRHQNDDVFASRRYKLDFDNYDNLRRSDEFHREYRDYDDWYHRRNIRDMNHFYRRYTPVPWEIRRTRYYYRVPHHIDLIWTPLLFHRFMYYYPTHNNWDMEFGNPIETISAYEAREYAGTVRRVYGKVDEVFFSPGDENYILYIGAPFPYQDISVVIPKHIARNITMSPKWFFEDEFVWVVGLINVWEGKPEIIVRDEDQIRKY